MRAKRKRLSDAAAEAAVRKRRPRSAASDESREPLPEILQQDLLALLCFDTERALAIKARVPLGYFEGPWQDIARRTYEYLDEHKRAPGHVEELFYDITDATKKNELRKLLRELLRIYEHPQFNPDHVMRDMGVFVRHQGLLAATTRVFEELQTGQQHASAMSARSDRIVKIYAEAVTAFHRQPGGRLASTIKPRNPTFLWWPYLVAGEINVVGGKGGIGKGILLASIAAHVTNGAAWPDRSKKSAKGHVLWAEAEDSIETTVVPRLIANEADLSRVTTFNRDEFLSLDLGRFVRSNDVRLIVLSPLSSFLPRLRNSNDEIAVRDALTPLHESVQNTQCAVAPIMHLNKKTDLDAVERLLGSVAYGNFVRSVLLINYDEQVPSWRRVIHAKYNLSPKGPDLCFEIESADNDPESQYVEARWHLPGGQDVEVDSFLDRRKSSGQKLSAADRREIEKLLREGELTHKEIAGRFGVNRSWVSQIAGKMRKEKRDDLV